MRVIIAGSRGFKNYRQFLEFIKLIRFEVTSVVCGEAPGIDLFGKRWAKERKIPYVSFPADWDNLGRSAGYIRNQEMANNADALFVLWDGKSPGTKHMVNIAKKKGLKIQMFIARPENSIPNNFNHIC